MFGGFARFAGDFDAAMIELGDAVSHADLRQLMAIGAEGICLDNLRAGFRCTSGGRERRIRRRMN